MMGKKKTGAYMGGGMAKKKGSMYNKGGSMYNKGGMPMVMKAGKKVPAFAADGVGKMNMGGMAKKKKPMASTGYKEGGEVKKKETFGQAFKRNRNKFKSSGSAADYTFKHNGKSYNILQKGETKAGVMKKFSAPTKSVRPKLRPAPPISDNTKKKITSTVRDVMAVKALPEDGPDKTPRKKPPRVANSVRAADKPVANSGKGGENKPIRKKTRFRADGTVKGPGQSARPGARPKPTAKPTRKADGVPARLREKSPEGLPKGIGGMLNRKDEPGAPFLGSKGGKSAALRRKDVIEGQSKLRDRGAPAQLTLSQRNLRKFKSDPSSLTKIQKDRLFKSLKRQGVTIPKGLSGNNR